MEQLISFLDGSQAIYNTASRTKEALQSDSLTISIPIILRSNLLPDYEIPLLIGPKL